jgi:hypothetical protein
MIDFWLQFTLWEVDFKFYSYACVPFHENLADLASRTINGTVYYKWRHVRTGGQQLSDVML